MKSEARISGLSGPGIWWGLDTDSGRKQKTESYMEGTEERFWGDVES